jgi:hypothetical protein
MGLGLLLIGLSVAALAAGLIGLGTGQPYGVWFFLAMPGLVGVCVLGPLWPLLRKRYREAKERRMQAEDLR